MSRDVPVIAALVCLAALVGASACTKRNEKFCRGAPHNNCELIDGGATPCESNDDCEAPTAVCNTMSGPMVCVQCVAPEQVSACGGTEPVCGADHTCQPCSAHAQCATNACLPDGSCGDDTSVAYVAPAPAGSDNPMCTRAMPCTTVANALATERPFVKFAGTTDEAVSISDQTVTLLADPGAKLTRTNNGLILEIKGTSQVEIYDLEISGGSGAQGIGISIPPGSAASLRLTRALVANNAAGGVVATSGSLTVSQSTFSDNQDTGISMSGASLLVTRSTFSGNQGVGISTSGGALTVERSLFFGNQGGAIAMVADGQVSILNNIIHHNGDVLTATTGGISIRPMGASKVEFNTIVDNQANTGAASAGGVFCDVTGFIAPSNIIFRNTGGADRTIQTFGNCTYGNSLNVPGVSPVDNSPGFVSPNVQPLDYHLSPTSPTTIVDAAGACTGEDFDGDTRPVGGACDLGADERKP